MDDFEDENKKGHKKNHKKNQSLKKNQTAKNINKVHGEQSRTNKIVENPIQRYTE